MPRVNVIHACPLGCSAIRPGEARYSRQAAKDQPNHESDRR